MKKTRGFRLEKASLEDGQGLVEYAMIMVMVAVVILVVLAMLGPSIGNLYSRVMTGINHANIGYTPSAERTGNGNGNEVVVTITATRQVNLSMRNRQNGATITATCSSTCSYTFSGAGNAASAIDITSNGVTTAVPYPAKN